MTYEPGTTYGPGGYDPSHPVLNVVERVADNGDGTGVRTVYDPDGVVVATEVVPVDLPEVRPVDELADLRVTVAALLSIIEGGV